MFWNIIYAYITVNFYWSELDTLSGQIYYTLDILDIVHSYNKVYSLNISRQTFCVTGYIKNSRTRTFCVVECETGHKI